MAQRTGDAAVDAGVIEISGLDIDFLTLDGEVKAVRGASFSVARGEILALVGESGSGKSVTSRAVLGLLPRNAQIEGSIELAGDELVGLSERELGSYRGGRVAMVFQDPSRALNPVFTIGDQMVDTLLTHTELSRKEAKLRAIELLTLVGIPEPDVRFGYYPHQLSGGQKQRVVIATALSCEPDLIIADEPTTALDVTVQAEILDLLRDLRDRLGTAILLITHNMGVVADIADRVAVMYHGEIVEISDVHEMFANPKADYTRRLLSVVPRLESALVGGAKRSAPDRTASDVEALKVENLSVRFSRGWGRGSFTAVEDVSFSIAPGETLAVVGESGSGKSTIAKSIAGLEQASEGAILIGGRRVDNASTREARLIRSAIGYVFQDPTWSLNPRHTVADSIAAPLQAGTSMTAEEASHRIDELLDAVRLPRSVRKKFPHELSGGQAQRVSIARAVIRRPSLLIADEPTSALDVSVQAQVLDLLAELQESIGFACLFITHDLAVVASFADRVLVMSKGKMVESGDVRQVLGSPAEEYTRRLVAAVPVADPTLQNERRMARRG